MELARFKVRERMRCGSPQAAAVPARLEHNSRGKEAEG